MDKRILIVEDDADMLFILQQVLGRAGYFVEALGAGNSIVEKKYTLPDLFILDKNVPTIDGIAICKYLKVQPDTRDIPIIMISGDHQFATKARMVGINDFLEKPFDVSKLLQMVKKYLPSSEMSGTTITA